MILGPHKHEAMSLSKHATKIYIVNILFILKIDSLEKICLALTEHLSIY